MPGGIEPAVARVLQMRHSELVGFMAKAGTVLVFGQTFPLEDAIGITILCGVISAVTAFMVRVIHLRMPLGFTMWDSRCSWDRSPAMRVTSSVKWQRSWLMLLGLYPGHAYGVISVVVEFKVDVAGIEALPCVRSNDMHLGSHFSDDC